MLISAYMIRPGDVLITAVHTEGRTVKDVWITEDGTVRVVYDNDKFEWFDNKALVVRRNSDD